MLMYEIGMVIHWFDSAKLQISQCLHAGRKAARQAAATPRSVDLFENVVQIPDFRIFNTVQNETLSFSWFQIDPNEPEYLEYDL